MISKEFRAGFKQFLLLKFAATPLAQTNRVGLRIVPEHKNRNFHNYSKDRRASKSLGVRERCNMKLRNTQFVLGLVAALMLPLGSAFGIPVNVTMSGGVAVVAAPDSDLGDFGDTTVFNWLTTDVTSFNSTYSTSYPMPTENLNGTPLQKVSTGSGPSSITLSVDDYDYLFFHWGGQNGGWAQAFYVGDSSGSVEFDAPPGGHPAVGGLSFYSIYGAIRQPSAVPDAANTFATLGIGIAGLSFVGSKMKSAWVRIR